MAIYEIFIFQHAIEWYVDCITTATIEIEVKMKEGAREEAKKSHVGIQL